MVDRRTIRLMMCAGLVLASVAYLPGAAGARHEPNHEEFRIFWKPTVGHVSIEAAPTGELPGRHKVSEDFTWSTPHSTWRLDDPRTGDKGGIWEQEIRFMSAPGERALCDDDPVKVVREDMPQPGEWEDNWARDEGEFTWKARTYDITPFHKYHASFFCKPDSSESQGPIQDDYHVGGQIGHCSAIGCGQSVVVSDEGVTFVPKLRGPAPDAESWSASFPGSIPSFETGRGEWVAQHASLTRECNPQIAWHRDCYAVLRADPGDAHPIMEFEYRPFPAGLGTASIYSEFAVQCPSGPNAADCGVQAWLATYDAQGALVGTRRHGIWRTIPRATGDQKAHWKFVRVANEDGFPNNPEARYYRFWLKIGANTTVRVDYHQQWYLVPA